MQHRDIVVVFQNHAHIFRQTVMIVKLHCVMNNYKTLTSYEQLQSLSQQRLKKITHRSRSYWTEDERRNVWG